MTTTLVTWNLKGSEAPDTDRVVALLRAAGADVVALQEVQWHQARRIARGLGARSWRWGFKHWPLDTWPEGMAVIGVDRRVAVRTRALSHRWRLWSWQRRIMQIAVVHLAPRDGDDAGADEVDRERDRDDAGPADADADDDAGADGAGTPVVVANLHLTPHGEVALRAVETATVVELVTATEGPTVVCGDLNERPGGAVHHVLAAAGLRDASGTVHGDPPDRPATVAAPDPRPTNWRGWQRGTERPPVQQLDYVYVSTAVAVADLTVPTDGDDDLAPYAAVSDHLPVTARLALGPEGAADDG